MGKSVGGRPSCGRSVTSSDQPMAKSPRPNSGSQRMRLRSWLIVIMAGIRRPAPRSKRHRRGLDDRFGNAERSQRGDCGTAHALDDMRGQIGDMRVAAQRFQFPGSVEPQRVQRTRLDRNRNFAAAARVIAAPQQLAAHPHPHPAEQRQQHVLKIIEWRRSGRRIR